ncbi:MAG: YidC/Oxa1 family rane protein insertase [Candidatus Binataceae bacterium]|nr:YidC/Oxa1 family rane protein insertase [Candidatus Binataceae bacterium]
MENSRLLTFLIISLAIVILYNQLLQWRHPELAHRQTRVGATASPTAAPTPSPEQAARTLSAPSTALSTPGASSLAAARTITIDTRRYQAELTARGARLASFRLKDYRQTDAPDSPPYEAVAGGDRLPLGLVIARGGAVSDDGEIVYSSDAPARIDVDAGGATDMLTGATAEGLKLTKTFAFKPDGYVIEVTAAVNAPPAMKIDGIGLQLSRPLKENAGFRDVPELQADVQDKVINEAQKALEKGVAPVTGRIIYAGFGDRYFLTALMPLKPAVGTLSMDYVGDEADARIIFDGTTMVTSAVFIGPKELDVLEAVNPSLKKTINFGWTSIIALPFLKLLKVFYRIAPNYGLAIILLTIVVRLVTLPMSIKGQRSMMRMQRLQPQVERIREKHKDDQERLNREMVDLYKRNHVNPLGGCLPMAVQLPVFFGLYEALLNAIELRHAPFIGWIKDLSAPDCLPVSWIPLLPFTQCHGIPVLVILMTITAFVQQWMAPKQPDPNQQKMMMYMPVVFSLIFVNMPAGLTLYYFSSNLLGVVQQFILNREFQQLPVPAAT